jgi:hypothetical protein
MSRHPKPDHSFALLHAGLTADLIRKHVDASQVTYHKGILGLKTKGIVQLCQAIENDLIPSDPEQKGNAAYLRHSINSILPKLT